MLNFRLLNVLTSSRSIRSYLAILSILGAGVLIDILLILKLSLIIGPWITMTILAANTAAGIYCMYYLTEKRKNQLISGIKSGIYDPDAFSRYLTSLLASMFIIIPGLLNTVLGVVMLLPPFSIKLGNRTARTIGIDWYEAYEFLRLDYVTDNGENIFAEG